MREPARGGRPEWTFSTKYKVIAKSPNSVTATVERTPQSNEPETSVLHFVSPDCYWVELKIPNVDTTGWKEYFERVSP